MLWPNCKMRLNKYILILLAMFLPGCVKSSDKLFWITENSGQKSDFLFLAESGNLPMIGSDSLELFFSRDELNRFEKDSIVFRNYGKIYEGEKFKAYILLMSMETTGRFYTFVIRTYDNEFKLIDIFELATWAESKSQYCFGSINKDLTIERQCNYKGAPDTMQIMENGEIIML